MFRPLYCDEGFENWVNSEQGVESDSSASPVEEVGVAENFSKWKAEVKYPCL